MKDLPRKSVLFIVGPTGSGKSELAIEVAKALNGEILSCDSMQVYKGLDIGTDKPSRWVRFRLRHHLIGIVSPKKEFSVFEYRDKFIKALKKIERSGKFPVAVGGTGLYVKAVVDGISPHPGKNEEVRGRLRSLAAKYGIRRLYETLAEMDPQVASRIHPNDEKRIIRALEVLEISGKSLGEWEKETEGLGVLGYRFWIVGIHRDRKTLYDSIDRRVDRMFKKGLVREADKFKNKLSLTASQAIGYREFCDYHDGKIGVNEVRDRIKQHTRNLAKRQIIWFRRDKRIVWIEGSISSMKDQILTMLKTVGLEPVQGP